MKKPEHISLLEAEKADFAQRCDTAQRYADTLQRQINNLQAQFQNASREVVAYEAAAQAFGIALTKLTAPKTPVKKGPLSAKPNPAPAA